MADPLLTDLYTIIEPAMSAIPGGIDMTVTGTTDLFVNPSTASGFMPVRILMQQVQATNPVLPAAISIGHTGANYEDMLPLTTLPAIAVQTLAYIEVARSTAFAFLPENATLKVNVRTAATVGIGGSDSVRFYVQGFFLPTS